jgi:hypothetical protein
MTPDIRDLSDMLEQLRTRHTVFYYTAIVLSAFGIFGLLCLMGAFLNGVNH